MALFPLPQSVNFPGSILPLHIFEPRYRAMIEFCEAEGVWLGVAHTQQQIKTSEGQLGLNENHNAYLSCQVFGAGPIQVLEKYADGRFLVEVQIQSRFRLKDKIQTIPFEIVDAEEFFDEDRPSEFQEFYKNQLEQTLSKLLSENGVHSRDLFSSPEWRVMNLSKITFQFLNFVRFDSEVAQKLLEMRSSQERAQEILKILNVEYSD